MKIRLKSGWDACVEIAEQPLALIKFINGKTTHRARFDVDKRSFIDQIPGGVSENERDQLVKLLNHECLDIIPNTFVVCGEGGNYCSQACMDREKK